MSGKLKYFFYKFLEIAHKYTYKLINSYFYYISATHYCCKSSRVIIGQTHFCMTSYNFEANAIARIVDIWLIVVILALWIENGEKINDGYILSKMLMFYFSKWVTHARWQRQTLEFWLQKLDLWMLNIGKIW
jgi:hypothetical protein